MSAATATATMASLSLEWRPTDSLHFYLDMIGGRTFNDMDRSDIDWGVRAGAGAQPLIPEMSC